MPVGEKPRRSGNRPVHVVQFWDKPIPPPDVLEMMATWEGAKGLSYTRFNAATAAEYIAAHAGQRALEAFNSCMIPAMQADFFRYCYLLHSGGLYADADTALSDEAKLLSVLESCGRGLLMTRRAAVANDFLYVAEPGDAFFAAALEKAITNIERQCSVSVWEVTGPRILTTLHRKHGGGPLLAGFTFIDGAKVKAFVNFSWKAEYKKTEDDWRGATNIYRNPIVRTAELPVTAVLHLGMPKTGTSILQFSLAKCVLNPGGEHILLPKTGRLESVSGHHELAKILGGDDDGAIEGAAQALTREIRDSFAKHPGLKFAACSSESMIRMCGPEKSANLGYFIRRIESAVNVRVVVVVRELAGFFQSMYLQTARSRGHIESFQDYMLGREKWAKHLFKGIVLLKGLLGDRFDLQLAVPGFDTLSYFESMLMLGDGHLHRLGASFGSTSTKSLKIQAALTYLDEMSRRAGFEIDRRRLAGTFRKGFGFDGDTFGYSLYADGEQRKMFEKCRALAVECGLPEYAAAFDAPPGATGPFARLASAIIDDADVAALQRMRKAIASSENHALD